MYLCKVFYIEMVCNNEELIAENVKVVMLSINILLFWSCMCVCHSNKINDLFLVLKPH